MPAVGSSSTAMSAGRPAPGDLHAPLVSVRQRASEPVEEGRTQADVRQQLAARSRVRSSSRRTQGGEDRTEEPGRIRAWCPTITFSTADIAPNRRMF